MPAQSVRPAILGLLTLSSLACPSKTEAPAHTSESEATTRPSAAPTDAPSSRPEGALAADPTTTASVSPARVRTHVERLAADELEGRGASTRGLELAAEYLERELRSLGLGPAFGSSYRQPFELDVAVELGSKSSLVQGRTRFAFGEAFIPLAFSDTGTTSGPLLFVGYGIRAPELGYDDYRGVEPKGRVVVFFDGEPGELDEASPFDGKRTTRHASLRGKILTAREAGARAALVVREKLPRRGVRAPESGAGLISFAITVQTAQKLLAMDPLEAKRAIDRTYKPQSRALGPRQVSLRADVRRTRMTNANIGGLIEPPGAPAAEAVLLGAHYDHLGLGDAGSLSGRDRPEIHNGADDNASGCAAVLEAARSLSLEPKGLKRRVYILFFAGEESGLLGSQHFVKNPSFPLEDLVAMVNLDMVGHLRGGSFDVMGAKSGAGLSGLIEKLAATRGLTARLGGGAVGPSDHTAFYTRGVPVAFLFTGAHEHYHRPSDDADTLNYAGLATMSALAADLTRALASGEHKPGYVRVEEPKAASAGRGYGPSFGSIPEFGEPTDGVPLSGVRPGSPAEKAGVRAGDVIVEFDGVRVQNLTDFTEVLRSKAPGDEVEVAVRRGREVLRLRANLERRDP